jgi:hypothetical protein
MNDLRSGDVALLRNPGTCSPAWVIVVHVPPPAHAGGPQRGDREYGCVLARFPVLCADGRRSEPEWMAAQDLLPLSLCWSRGEEERRVA